MEELLLNWELDSKTNKELQSYLINQKQITNVPFLIGQVLFNFSKQQVILKGYSPALLAWSDSLQKQANFFRKHAPNDDSYHAKIEALLALSGFQIQFLYLFLRTKEISSK